MALTWAVFHGFLLILNWCLTIIGICTMICGAVLEDYIRNLDNFLDTKFHAPPVLLIISGIMIFVGAWMGLCGGVFFSFFVLVWAGMVLIVFLVAQVSAGALALKFREDYGSMKLDRINEWGAEYKKHVDSLNSMHRYLRCCSVKGSDLPSSCCQRVRDDCSSTSADLMTTDCGGKLKEFIHTEAIVVAVVAFVFGMITVVVILIEFCVAFVLLQPAECRPTLAEKMKKQLGITPEDIDVTPEVERNHRAQSALARDANATK